MTYDFRANQVRTNRIISSGSIPIIFYHSSSATDLQGGKSFPDPGADVFFFVSGSSTAKTLFGGDVVVSGALSASQLTGSLQSIAPGIPYLTAGANISISTNSLGQVSVTGADVPYYINIPSSVDFTFSGSSLSASKGDHIHSPPDGLVTTDQTLFSVGSWTVTASTGFIPGGTGSFPATDIARLSLPWAPNGTSYTYFTGPRIERPLLASGYTGTKLTVRVRLAGKTGGPLNQFGSTNVGLFIRNDADSAYEQINVAISDPPAGQNVSYDGTSGGGGGYALGYAPSFDGTEYLEITLENGTALSFVFVKNGTSTTVGTRTVSLSPSHWGIFSYYGGHAIAATTFDLDDPQEQVKQRPTNIGLSLIEASTQLDARNIIGAGTPTTPWNDSYGLVWTTSSVGIKTSITHSNIDLFISGSDATGNGANLVLYNDLSGFGFPSLILSSSSGSLGGLLGFDDDINGLVNGINIDIPENRSFGFRIGGLTAAATIDPIGNLNVRSGSASTAYFDTLNEMVGIGTDTPSTTYSANASKVVIKDTLGTSKYQLFITNENNSVDINSGIAFAFGPSKISGAIYAKSNITGNDRKGLNVLIPADNSFSWRTTGAHLGELTDSGSLIISGSIKAYTGFTGSLSGTIGGLPFIVGGPNITANYNTLEQWAITGSGGGTPGGLDKQIQFNSGSTFSGSSNLTYNYTTSALILTGSLTASTIAAGGVNITPLTASLVFGGDGVNRASGSISGLFESGSLMTRGTIGKFDVEILGMDFNAETGASWKYTTTALWPYSGNFTFIAATELAAEYGPATVDYNPAADWDVNFNSLGQIELTGSAPAFPHGGTSFYVQVTKKMVATYAGVIA